jgi:hypothetical protein
VSKGGSRTKTDHHWALACHVFAEDPEIKETFLRVTEAADMKIWGRKIKNRIDRYVQLEPITKRNPDLIWM